MGTYRSSHPMVSDANRTASIPHFAWFHPGNILSTSRTEYNPLQATHINADAAVIAIPVRSVPPLPTYELARDVTAEHSREEKPKTLKRTSKNASSITLKPPTKSTKKAKTSNTTVTTSSTPVAKREKKDLNFVTYEGNLDISSLPSPFCSCTGVSRQCYRWGAGGWQSSCCTINISEYPLPMSTTRPTSRMAGRKMSSGAYEKLIQRLNAENYHLSYPIDLKEHWARHGTNKFVTIK